MQCNTCRNEAVIFQPASGRHLCGRHLVLDIESRAKRSIRSHHWMETGDHIAVVLSGDKRSAALVRFLQKLVSGRRDIRLSAVPAGDTGTGVAPAAATGVAASLGVPCIEMPRHWRTPGPDGNRITKLALAFTLDDIAREVLVQFLSGSTGQLIQPLFPASSAIPVICPFVAIPSAEADMYWDLEGTGTDLLPSLPSGDPLTRETKILFRDYQQRHPATGHALLHLTEQLSHNRVADIAASATARNWDGPSFIIPGVTRNGT